MTYQHPITPPDELVLQWMDVWYRAKVKHVGICSFVATQAARWGADSELKACLDWMAGEYLQNYARRLRADRRPKSPSLKEQALAKLTAMERLWEASGNDPSDIIRRALEQLP